MQAEAKDHTALCGEFHSREVIADSNMAKFPCMKSRLFFVIVLLLSLSGCGAIFIGYSYAAPYLRHSINSYISYNDTQQEIIKQDVNEFMTWHRHAMLPEYVNFLRELHDLVKSGAALKKDDVSRCRAEVKALYIKTLLPVIKPAAKLMSELNAEQVDELVLSFAKENKKQRENELDGSIEEQLRKRAERTIELIEKLTGSFTDNQLEIIREMNRNLPYATPLYHAQREDNQKKLIELLKNNKSEVEIAATFTLWLYTPEIYRSDQERIMMRDFENGSDEMIANIYQILNEQQINTLLKNIANYINTFQELANST